VLAHFSIWPLHGTFIEREVATAIIETLEQLRVEYDIGAMGTTIRGEWDQVMAAILSCHQAIAASHQRVLTHIFIDDHQSQSPQIEEAIAQASQQRIAHE